MPGGVLGCPKLYWSDLGRHQDAIEEYCGMPSRDWEPTSEHPPTWAASATGTPKPSRQPQPWEPLNPPGSLTHGTPQIIQSDKDHQICQAPQPWEPPGSPGDGNLQMPQSAPPVGTPKHPRHPAHGNPLTLVGTPAVRPPHAAHRGRRGGSTAAPARPARGSGAGHRGGAGGSLARAAAGRGRRRGCRHSRAPRAPMPRSPAHPGGAPLQPCSPAPHHTPAAPG